MRHLLLPVLAVAYGGGIALSLQQPVFAPAAAVATALAMGAGALSARIAGTRGGSAALMAAVFGLGLLRATLLPLPPPPPSLNGRLPTTARAGVVVRGPWIEPGRLTVDVETDDGRRVRAYVSEPHWTPELGARVRFRAPLRARSSRANPGSRPIPEGGPAWTASVRDGAGFLWESAPPSPLARLQQRRARAAERICRASGARLGGVLSALGLGARGRIPRTVRRAFAATGTAHTLAVSGLHLGIVALGLHRGLRWLLLRSARLALRLRVDRLTAAFTLLGLIVFTLWTGAATSTVRACGMAGLLLLGRLFDRRAVAADALAATALAILTLSPEVALTPSFQLSVAAVSGLLAGRAAGAALARRLEDTLGPGSRRAVVGRWLGSALWASVCASAATAPILAYHFHGAAPASVLTNLVAVPVVSFVVLPLALLAAILATFAPEPLFHVVVDTAAAATEIWLDAVELMATAAPDPALPAGPGAPTCLALAAPLLILGPLLRARSRELAVAAVALGVVLFAAPFALPDGLGSGDSGGPGASHTIEGVFLGVGHGTAVVLRFPGGADVLVDGGGARDGRVGVGRRDVLPALRALGIRRLDTVVLSHGDADHVAGLLAVAEELPIDRLWLSAGGARTLLARRLVRMVRARGGEVRELGRGDPATLGTHPVDVLWPPRDLPAASENDRSLCLAVGWPGSRLVLTGDIERTSEQALVLGGRLPQATLLQAPHHGSHTSSTEPFVGALAPRAVVYSHGPGRRPPLPAPAVAHRYRAVGAIEFDTADDGAVRFRLTRDGLAVESSGKGPRPRRRRLRLRSPEERPGAPAPGLPAALNPSRPGV